MSIKAPTWVLKILFVGPKWQHLLGYLALLAWMIWWAFSFSLDVPRLVGGEFTYMTNIAWPYIGLDFIHEYSGGSTLANGDNPYHYMSGHPMYQQFTYPPIVLPFFAWCKFLPPDRMFTVTTHGFRINQVYPLKAVMTWIVLLSAMFTFATYNVWQFRNKSHYGNIAFPLALAMILFSFPVVFAMERGSCDALMLTLILLGCMSLSKKTLYWDILSGLCFAVATWMKLYPGFLLLALLVLRRWRAAGFTFGFIVSIGLTLLPWTLEWYNIIQSRLQGNYRSLLYAHTISGSWFELWAQTPFDFLTKIPGLIGGGFIVLPLAGVVGWIIFRYEHREKLLLPYILWMTSLSTFLPLISFDYNLFYLPLGVLAIWRRKDPFWVHFAMAYLLLWWQPFLINQTPLAGLIFKFIGVAGLGFCLIAKTKSTKQHPELALS